MHRRPLLCALTLSLVVFGCGFLGGDSDEDSPFSLQGIAAGLTNAPEGRVTKESKTPECASGLTGALDVLKKEQGYGYETEEADGTALIDAGAVTKNYARDGVQHKLEFGLNATDGNCTLRLYKLTTRKPGRMTEVFPPHTATVKDCRCE